METVTMKLYVIIMFLLDMNLLFRYEVGYEK